MSQNVTELAQSVFDSLSENERHGVRFGIFPQQKMPNPDATGISHHDLVVEIMNISRKPASQVAMA
ncbi:MAG: hypothetical protein ING75_17360 [Rhodocyclaceae bacterium]|nr:hypothetical protein [Rhodocyclaceae bacterium]